MLIACKQKQHQTYKGRKKMPTRRTKLENATEPNSSNPKG
jgi:hypothetical protein